MKTSTRDPATTAGVGRLLPCFLGALLLAAPSSQAQSENTCLDCHQALDPPLRVLPEQFVQDVHAQAGLNCASCHGGDPTNFDPSVSMGRAGGFHGNVTKPQIPALCGRCHSDAAYMRQYNPSLRTDQLSQYKISIHGKRLAAGDPKVAVCSDCHNAHDVRPARDTLSKVNPLNVADTCAQCHANSGYMQGYSIPTNQFAEYSASVHHDAMVVRSDLSAPTCNTCHGSHGATPPGIDKVQNVCSTCHVFQARMYEKSTHKAAFQSASLPGCVVCHSNHRINHPSDAMLGTGHEAVCMRCHTPGDSCDQARAELLSGLIRLDAAIKSTDQVLGVAESSGMEVSEARLGQDQARDSLTKARVTVHSFRTDLMDQDIQAGLKVAATNFQAGKDTLRERDHRRIGLAISVLAIFIVLLGLRLYIRQIEGQLK